SAKPFPSPWWLQGSCVPSRTEQNDAGTRGRSPSRARSRLKRFASYRTTSLALSGAVQILAREPVIGPRQHSGTARLVHLPSGGIVGLCGPVQRGEALRIGQ